MRRVALALALACTPLLSGCGTVAHPASIARKSAASADAAYIAASAAGQQLVALGRLDKERYKALDNQAYAALLVVRQTAKEFAAGAGTQATVQAALVMLTSANALLQSGGK